MKVLRIGFTMSGVVLGGLLAWRYAARRWRLPCPATIGWILESGLREWATPTPIILARMGVRPGLRVLEVGPGIGYLTVPVARRLGSTGDLVALELQPAMARRTQARVVAAGLTNVAVRGGDVTTAQLEPATYDLAFLVTVLGEIPDQDRALARLATSLKPGGILSITEVFGDPHYQRYAAVARRCRAAGLVPAGRAGSWRFYTANFQRAVSGARL